MKELKQRQIITEVSYIMVKTNQSSFPPSSNFWQSNWKKSLISWTILIYIFNEMALYSILQAVVQNRLHNRLTGYLQALKLVYQDITLACTVHHPQMHTLHACKIITNPRPLPSHALQLYSILRLTSATLYNFVLSYFIFS